MWSSSSTVRVLILAVLGLASVAGKVDDIGPCHSILSNTTEPHFNFDKVATEKGESWKFQLVPRTAFYEKVKRMWLVSVPTTQKGVHDTTIYYETTLGEVKVLVKERVFDISGGRATAISKGSDGNEIEYKITFYKNVPGKYVCYYICSDDGGDSSTDYRFVLTHEELDEEALREIDKLDKQHKFKNTVLKLQL